jgi:hypothetical protein
MERNFEMINPRKAHQMYAPPSEFEMFLEVWAAGNFNGLINRVDRVMAAHTRLGLSVLPHRVSAENGVTPIGPSDPYETSEPGNEHGAHSLPEIHSVCANCRCPITRDLEYELHLPKEGERWYHDDYVDGTEDGRCDGVSCQNETDDAEATVAEPEVEYERRVRG